MKDVVVFRDFIKKVRDMSGLLPKFIIELSLEWSLSLIYQELSNGTGEPLDAEDLAAITEFVDIYNTLDAKAKGCEISSMEWSRNSTPLYFVARGAIDVCLVAMKTATAKQKDGHSVDREARIILGSARFAQICGQVALGLGDMSNNIRKTDCRRYADLIKEADSFILAGSSYGSGRSGS